MQQQARAEERRGWDATDSPQNHDCAGDASARSDGGTAMHSPAAKDPDLTSGLREFNPGRARFQGSCVCLFFACLLLACCLLVACLLLACCLLLLVFYLLFVSPSSREAKLRSRAERHRYASCFRYVSVTFPLRFRYVSVTFPLRFRYISVTFPLRSRYVPATFPLRAPPGGPCQGQV